jgi:hypothetical protein
MEHFKDIGEAGDEFVYARALLIVGLAGRKDKLTYTRAGKPSISATVGWWADHCVGYDNGTPVFKLYRETHEKGRRRGSQEPKSSGAGANDRG